LRLSEPLGQRLESQKVKALWIQGWQVAAYWQSVWQAHSAGVPVWLRGESNDLAATPQWKKPVKRFALRQFFSRISDFLYIGKANRRLYERYGVNASNLHPAYYCVDNDRFAIQAEVLRPERLAIRRAWGIPDDSFCILFAGKLIDKKRPYDLVAATAQLQAQGLNKRFHLLFAGSGELSDQIKQACAVVFNGNGSNGHNSTSAISAEKPDASFVGFLNQTEISKAYVAADLLVLPSDHRETWGLVVNEALASGLQCVTSTSCGCTEDLIATLNPKLTFAVGNTVALAGAIRNALEEPVSAERIKSTIQNFSPLASISSVTSLYTRALSSERN
jgi:glycosyltransferase involved in cell wall biosynthesis